MATVPNFNVHKEKPLSGSANFSVAIPFEEGLSQFTTKLTRDVLDTMIRPRHRDDLQRCVDSLSPAALESAVRAEVSAMLVWDAPISEQIRFSRQLRRGEVNSETNRFWHDIKRLLDQRFETLQHGLCALAEDSPDQLVQAIDSHFETLRNQPEVRIDSEDAECDRLDRMIDNQHKLSRITPGALDSEAKQRLSDDLQEAIPHQQRKCMETIALCRVMQERRERIAGLPQLERIVKRRAAQSTDQRLAITRQLELRRSNASEAYARKRSATAVLLPGIEEEEWLDRTLEHNRLGDRQQLVSEVTQRAEASICRRLEKRNGGGSAPGDYDALWLMLAASEIVEAVQDAVDEFLPTVKVSPYQAIDSMGFQQVLDSLAKKCQLTTSVDAYRHAQLFIEPTEYLLLTIPPAQTEADKEVRERFVKFVREEWGECRNVTIEPGYESEPLALVRVQAGWPISCEKETAAAVVALAESSQGRDKHQGVLYGTIPDMPTGELSEERLRLALMIKTEMDAEYGYVDGSTSPSEEQRRFQ